MSCPDMQEQIHLYIDGELAAADALNVEAHLVDCAPCRAEYDGLRGVVEAVRAGHPVYQAPEESAARVAEMVRQHGRRAAMWRGLVAASILATGFLGWTVFQETRARQDRFASFAAESHLRYAKGSLPLDIREKEPKAVAEWLTGRLPFHLTLPNYPQGPGAVKKYSLEGARLLQYGEDDVAYLAYRMEDRPISLLIASANRVKPDGGTVLASGGLSFHTASYKGLQMITWIDKGLSYALVSDLEAVGAESCVICHGGENEQKKFDALRPRI